MVNGLGFFALAEHRGIASENRAVGLGFRVLGLGFRVYHKENQAPVL